MHELALCRHLLRTLQDQARRRGYHKVLGVTLEIGPYSAVDPDALSFAWRVARRDTLASASPSPVPDPPWNGCGGDSPTPSPQAHLDAMERHELPPDPPALHIAPSRDDDTPRRATIPPDLAPCPACRRELQQRSDRRHRYPGRP